MSECPNNVYCVPASPGKIIAVFRGTGSTYCGFVDELSFENNGFAQAKSCSDGRSNSGGDLKRVATVGSDIPHLSQWLDGEDKELARTYLTDPISGQAFPIGTVFYFPANESRFEEAIRASWETLFSVLGKKKKYYALSGKRFSRVYCHSNGCTQAQAAAKHGYIQIDELYHLGSPWFTTPTSLDATVHTQFRTDLDGVSYLSIVRFFHIPFIVFDQTGRRKEGEVFQSTGASPIVSLNGFGELGNSHLLRRYFTSLRCWNRALHEFRMNRFDRRFPVEHDCTYDFPDFADPGIRSSFPSVFNIASHPEGYKGFNLQRGFKECSTGGSVDDCNDSIYVNHRLSKHEFKSKSTWGRKNQNDFSSPAAALQCIDEVVENYTVSQQLDVGVFSICDR